VERPPSNTEIKKIIFLQPGLRTERRVLAIKEVGGESTRKRRVDSWRKGMQRDARTCFKKRKKMVVDRLKGRWPTYRRGDWSKTSKKSEGGSGYAIHQALLSPGEAMKKKEGRTRFREADQGTQKRQKAMRLKRKTGIFKKETFVKGSSFSGLGRREVQGKEEIRGRDTAKSPT